MTSDNDKITLNIEKSKHGKSETRATVIPVKLDRQVVKIVRDRGYHSISEFIREAIRDKVKSWENYDQMQRMWDLFGGKIIAAATNTVDSKVQELTDYVNQVMDDQHNLQKDKDILKEYPKVAAEQDKPEDDEI